MLLNIRKIKMSFITRPTITSKPTLRGTKRVHPLRLKSKKMKFLRQMKSPMYLLSVRHFIKLYSRSKFPKIETHEVLKKRGDLSMWQDVRGNIIYISHEWAVRLSLSLCLSALLCIRYTRIQNPHNNNTGIKSCRSERCSYTCFM